MQPTLWLEDEAGNVWNLRPKNINSAGSSYLKEVSGTGFLTKYDFVRVKKDFVRKEGVPQQVPITGTMYFLSPEQIDAFETFIGEESKKLKLCYDPTGAVQPEDSDAKPWYKFVLISELTSEEQSRTGAWYCKIVMTPLSTEWTRDVLIEAEAELNAGNAHVYDYTYPYAYTAENRLHILLNNAGDTTGCRITLNNSSGARISGASWTVVSGETLQLAKWCAENGLPNGSTLVVDSAPANQEAYVAYMSNKESVADQQEANPQYVNFVELLPGVNDIAFTVGAQSGIYVSVSYTERKRIL